MVRSAGPVCEETALREFREGFFFMRLSVIICTYNPRRDYLERVLEALKAQALSQDEWELLLIDNASKERLSESWDLSWHRKSRHIRENQPGLTSARLCGIRESVGELLVFVDDDNVLAPDYLAKVVMIAREYPHLGVWSGMVLPEFERPPDPETENILGWLCIRKLDKDYWGNYGTLEQVPTGAGMCLRRHVAEAYAQSLMQSTTRQCLDRVGSNLSGWGDIDLAFCALDIGLGMGLFKALQVTHLIPSRRLEQAYLFKLAEDLQASRVLFLRVRGLEPPAVCRIDQLAAGILWWYRWLHLNPFLKRFLLAERRGRKKGSALIRKNSL